MKEQRSVTLMIDSWGLFFARGHQERVESPGLVARASALERQLRAHNLNLTAIATPGTELTFTSVWGWGIPPDDVPLDSIVAEGFSLVNDALSGEIMR